MKTEAINKINQFGKIGQILANIAKVFIIIALILVTIGTITVAALPKEAFRLTLNGTAQFQMDVSEFGAEFSDNDINSITKSFEDSAQTNTIELNGAKYTLESIIVDRTGMDVNTSAKAISFTLHDTLGALFVAIFTLALTIVTLSFVSQLCVAFKKCTSPFEENVIKKMQYFAFSLIPWAIMSSVSTSAMQSFYTGSFDLCLGVNLNMVIVVLVILAFTYIFKYGAILQQESDETL